LFASGACCFCRRVRIDRRAGIEDLESRKKKNDITVEFLDLFKKENGSYICRELLGCDLSTNEGKKYAMEKQPFPENWLSDIIYWCMILMRSLKSIRSFPPLLINHP